MKKRCLLIFSIVLLSMIPTFSSQGKVLSILSIDPVTHSPSIDVTLDINDENISKNDLRIIEDRQLIDIDSVSKIESKSSVAILIALDTSKSLTKKELRTLKRNIHLLLNALPGDCAISILTFNDSWDTFAGFTETKDYIETTLQKAVRSGKKTVLFDTIYNCAESLSKTSYTNKTIIALTDGKDEGSDLDIEDIISYSKNAGISISFITLCNGKSLKDITRISKRTDGQIFCADDESGITRYISQVTRNKGFKYLVSYKSSSSLPARKVTIEYLKNSPVIGASSFYTVDKPEPKPDFFHNFNSTLVIIILLIIVILIAAAILVRLFIVSKAETSAIKETPSVLPKRTPYHTSDKPVVYSSPPKSWLVERSGASSGKIFPIYLPELSIGTSHKAGLVIQDSLVSPLHLRIRFTNGSYYLFDLASERGTLLNGKKLLRPKSLNDFDEIKIGNTEFLFRSSGTPCE